MNKDVEVPPKHDEMFQAVVEAIKSLGGSGTVLEIDKTVARILNLTEKQVSLLHSKVGTRTKLSYNLAWTRTYLQAAGILENIGRGLWILTKKGYKDKQIDSAKITSAMRARGNKNNSKRLPPIMGSSKTNSDEDSWRDQIIQEILDIPASGFERLCQRILRESGFIDVQVIGGVGDNGIDGKGTLRVNGWLRFDCYFQCKRYKGSVGANEIRDFRGAMAGRSDKGIFITTGNFTKGARDEADRPGPAPLDLIDGTLLAEKMKELKLGVRIEHKEIITVTSELFDQFKEQ